MKNKLYYCLCLFAFVQGYSQTTLKGVVFEDKNNNARQDLDEPGIESVGVSNGHKVVLTNKKGEYSIEVLGDKPVFVIQPKAYKTAVKEDQIADFYALAPVGQGVYKRDFAMYSKEQDAFDFILLGDIQADVSDDLLHVEKLVVEELVDQNADLVFALGDLAFDNLEIFEPLKQTLAFMGTPIYYVIGNHDLNFEANNPIEQRDKTFIKTFGPSYYALFYAEQLILVLNNILPQGDHTYKGGIDQKQREFIEQTLDLLADKQQAITVMMHIPVEFMQDKQAFISLFDAYDQVFFASGHTHTQYQQYIQRKDRPEIHQLVGGAVCGSWWQGPIDHNGIPWAMMYDGTPKGYWRYMSQGAKTSLKYKVSQREPSYQMSIWVPEYKNWDTSALELNDNYIYANVFAGDQYTDVQVSIDQGPWKQMQLYSGVDPFYSRLITWQEKGRFQNMNTSAMHDAKRQSQHLWRFEIPRDLGKGPHVVKVRAVNAKLSLNHIQTRLLHIQ